MFSSLYKSNVLQCITDMLNSRQYDYVFHGMCGFLTRQRKLGMISHLKVLKVSLRYNYVLEMIAKKTGFERQVQYIGNYKG